MSAGALHLIFYLSEGALIKKMQSSYQLTYYFPDQTKYKTQDKSFFVANS